MIDKAFGSKAAIAGIGATEFSKDSGRSELQLAVEAIRSAVEDAGLDLASVDGLVTFSVDNNDEIDVATTLGLDRVRWFSRVPFGGGGACGIVHQAAAAVAAGVADVVVCFRALNERSGVRFGTGVYYRPVVSSTDVHRHTWYTPFGLLTPASWLAPVVTRYMHDYGVTTEDFGRVAVSLRANAARNPAARFYEQPITLEEHQASRWIAEPLRLFDCCLESDGAVAVVVCSTERARTLRHPPAVIEASSQGMVGGQESMTSYYSPDITRYPELELLAEELWSVSGLTPADIRTAILYDHFTPFVLVQLEHFGFCPRGEAAAFVADGHIERDGSLPVNTHGGQIGEAYIHGVNGVAEGVRQIRGTSPSQREGAEHVLVTSGTAIPTSALILGQDER